jgi:nucleoside-diphosphate-sugar epimerase
LPVEMTSGVQIRDYLDVKTAGRMIADIACNNKIGPMNICSGVPVSIKDMACKIAEEYGRKDLLMFGAKSLSSSEPLCVVGVV